MAIFIWVTHSQCRRQSFKQDTKSKEARRWSSHSHSIARECLSRQLQIESSVKYKKTKRKGSHLKMDRRSTRYSSRWRSQIRSLRTSRIPIIGWAISLLLANRIVSSSESLLTGGAPLSRQAGTHTTTRSFAGNSTLWRRMAKLNMVNDTLFTQNATDSRALITIVQPARVWAHKNTQVSRSSSWSCRTACHPSTARMCSLLQPRSDPRRCMDRPTASFCLKVSMVLTSWKLESISLWARELPGTSHSRRWLKSLESIRAPEL